MDHMAAIYGDRDAKAKEDTHDKKPEKPAGIT
jgi:hypothetical protein